MEPEELRPNPPPCLPLHFTDADRRDFGYAYVVRNLQTLDCLSVLIYGYRIRLKKLAKNHTLMDVFC